MISQDMALEILLFIAALLPKPLACLDMFNGQLINLELKHPTIATTPNSETPGL